MKYVSAIKEWHHRLHSLHSCILVSMRVLFSRCMECQLGHIATRKVSVCPSDKRVHCDKTEERSVQIFIPYEISLSLVF